MKNLFLKTKLIDKLQYFQKKKYEFYQVN